MAEEINDALRLSFYHQLTAWCFSVLSVLGQTFANLAYLMCKYLKWSMFASKEGIGHSSLRK